MATLVTGGAGFIGSYLVHDLLNESQEVFVLDLKAKPSSFPARAHYVQGNVLDTVLLDSLLKKVDAVVHFAAIVSVPVCQQEPFQAYESNLLATIHLLERVRLVNQTRKSPIRVLFASSSSVYGHLGKKGFSISENISLGNPLSFYASQKLASEQTLRLYCENFGIPTLSFRFFNVYGIGQDPTSPYSGVITVFTNAINQGKPLTLHGGGTQTRDFIHVTDITRACLAALKLPQEKLMGQSVNLGSGREVSIKELAEQMLLSCGKKVVVNTAEERSGDVKYSLSDVKLAKQLLGWESRVSLEAGLSVMLKNSKEKKAA